MDNSKKLLEDMMQKMKDCILRLLWDLVVELECEKKEINVSFRTSEEEEAYSMGIDCAIGRVKEKISEHITAYETENSKYFAEKRWRKEDVASILIGSGYESTEENVAKVIKTMQEKGYISVLLDCTDVEWRAITDAVEETMGGKELSATVVGNHIDNSENNNIPLSKDAYVSVCFGENNHRLMPLEDYLDIEADKYGFNSYEELKKAGYSLEIPTLLDKDGKPMTNKEEQ